MSDDPCDGCVEINTKGQTIDCYIRKEGYIDKCPCINCLIKPICSVPCEENLNCYVDSHERSKKRKLEEKQYET